MKLEYLNILTEHASEMTIKAGEVLFRKGEPANQFYLIESGRVALEAKDPGGSTTLVQHVEAGEVLGWSWLFPPFVWHLQARALEPLSVIVLSGAHLLIAAELDRQFGYELMKRVTQVLIHRLQATRSQMLAAQRESALAKP